VGRRGGRRMAKRAARTATKEIPFNRKQIPTPNRPIRMPAAAGPSTRVTLKAEEFRAMAFIRSSLPTISTKNDWRPGTSNAMTTPCSAARTTMWATVTTRAKTRPASKKARSMAAVWVRMISLSLDIRSARAPA